MTTHAVLKADVAGFLVKTNLTSDMATFVRMGEAKIARRVRVRAQETTSTLTVTSSTTALPTDYLSMRSVTVDVANKRTLEQMTPETIREAAVWDRGGDALAYSIEGTNIIVAPAQTNTDLNIVYFARFDALSADDDTNWLLTNAYDVYLYAVCEAAAIWLHDEVKEAKYSALFDRAVSELEDAEKKARVGGSARVSFGNHRGTV